MPGRDFRRHADGPAALDAASVRLPQSIPGWGGSPRRDARRRDVVEALLGLETAAARAPDSQALARRASGKIARGRRPASRWRPPRAEWRPGPCGRGSRTLAATLA